MPYTDQEIEAVLPEYAAKGFSLAVQLLGNSDDAADTVQEGLLALWRNRERLERNRNPRGWFYRVIRNLCVDRLRHRARGKTVTFDETLAPDDAAADPAETAQRKEYRVRLRHELGNLSPNLREILYLRDFHDLSYTDIAEVLAIPAGTVMSRLHRARMELRDRLGRLARRSDRE
ncbi:MAG: RNA polymerase sigma factor [Planctomycetes bacterium]|nr:RNA polymerase sigma factor [Planctomycetota bacterium]